MASPRPLPSTGANSPAPSHGTSATFGPGTSNNNNNNNNSNTAAPSSNAVHAHSPLAANIGTPGGLAPPGLNAGGAGGMQRSMSQSSAQSRKSNASAVAQEPPHVIDGPGGRILCLADIRGNIASLNQLAAETNAQAIIHTGDFGFYEQSSLERITDRTLRHLVQYSNLIPQALRNKLLAANGPRGGAGAAAAANASAAAMRQQLSAQPSFVLSEFPQLLDGRIKLNVPVFTVWGACEDVAVLERFRTHEYVIPNLHVLDEATTRAIEVGGVRLRLFGLGGAVVLHKLFDNGDGAATIAGGQGTMWTTVLQIGELVDTAQKTYDPTETRILITHASPGREGLLAQLALALKADLTISAGLHFRYGVSYNEFSVQHDADNFRNKLVHAKAAFGEIWDTVKAQVEAVIDDQQKILLNNALAVTNRVPPTATATGAAAEEAGWKNTWNWNLPDAAYGNLVLDVRDGRVSAETKSQGFNFAYRRNNNLSMSAATPVNTTVSPGRAISAAGAAVQQPATSQQQQQQQQQQNGNAKSPKGVSTGPAAAANGQQQQQQNQHKKGQESTGGASAKGGNAAKDANGKGGSQKGSNQQASAAAAAAAAEASGVTDGNVSDGAASKRSKSSRRGGKGSRGGAKSDGEASRSDGEGLAPAPAAGPKGADRGEKENAAPAPAGGAAAAKKEGGGEEGKAAQGQQQGDKQGSGNHNRGGKNRNRGGGGAGKGGQGGGGQGQGEGKAGNNAPAAAAAGGAGIKASQGGGKGGQEGKKE